jgi:hypothetical protein
MGIEDFNVDKIEKLSKMMELILIREWAHQEGSDDIDLDNVVDCAAGIFADVLSLHDVEVSEQDSLYLKKDFLNAFQYSLKHGLGELFLTKIRIIVGNYIYGRMILEEAELNERRYTIIKVKDGAKEYLDSYVDKKC